MTHIPEPIKMASRMPLVDGQGRSLCVVCGCLVTREIRDGWSHLARSDGNDG